MPFADMCLDLEAAIQSEGKSESENQLLYTNTFM